MQNIDLKRSRMYQDILENANGVRNARDFNATKIKEIADVIKSRDIKGVILSARGSSDNVCYYFKYLCEIFLGLPCGFSSPSVSTIYNAKLKYSNTLVIGLSESGNGLDILTVIEEAKKAGAMTIAITNSEVSLLAMAADYHLFLNCGDEKSLCATKSFICEMYLLAMLVQETSSNEYLKKNLDLVPELLEDTLKNQEKVVELAKNCGQYYDCYMLARGLNYVSALEAALKLQEVTYVKSKAYSISEFYYGPFSIVDNTQNIFLLHGAGRTNMDSYEMFEHLMDCEANVIVVSNDPYFKDYPKTFYVPKCEECISPFAIIETMQLFSCALALVKGNNPDVPRGTKRITVTR